jgi:hypothetical protein
MRHLVEEIDLGPYRLDEGQSPRYRLGRIMGRVQLTGFRKTGEGRRRWNSPLARF